MQNLDAFLHDFPDTDEYVHYCTGRGAFRDDRETARRVSPPAAQ
jgi:hypothetical protein